MILNIVPCGVNVSIFLKIHNTKNIFTAIKFIEIHFRGNYLLFDKLNVREPT